MTPDGIYSDPKYSGVELNDVFSDEYASEREIVPFLTSNKWAINVGIILVYMLIGVLFSMQMEGWRFVTALYVITQVVTTVGYGDVTVEKLYWHTFMFFYSFIGIAIVANILNDLLSTMMDAETEVVRQRVLHITERVYGALPRSMKRRVKTPTTTMVHSFLRYVFFLTSWALFFSTFEQCSCSYGQTLIEGCVENLCAETGGQVLDFWTALYMAQITLTTVGFGDYTPKTRLGRLFAICWMLLGVLSFGNFVTSLSVWFNSLKGRHRRQQLSCKPYMFRAIDMDNNGVLTRPEFRMFFLLQEGRVKMDAIRDIDTLFDSLDADGSGVLTYDEVAAALD